MRDLPRELLEGIHANEREVLASERVKLQMLRDPNAPREGAISGLLLQCVVSLEIALLGGRFLFLMRW